MQRRSNAAGLSPRAARPPDALTIAFYGNRSDNRPVPQSEVELSNGDHQVSQNLQAKG